MTKRPTLSALGGRLAKKDPPMPASGPPAAASGNVQAPATVPARPAPGKKAGTQPDGRKGVLLRLRPDAWLQLKSMAAEQTISRGEIFSMQSALEEALNDWFKRHGKPPLA